jgi:hypothetical protein
MTIKRDTGQDAGGAAGRGCGGLGVWEARYWAAAPTALRITDTMPSQFPFTQWS